jgi:hypothetical protein
MTGKKQSFNFFKTSYLLFDCCWYVYKFRRQQFVGRPLFSHIDFTGKKFYVATENNVLSALNIKTGNIGKEADFN